MNRDEYVEWWLLRVADDDWKRVYGKIPVVVRGRLRAVTCRRVHVPTEDLLGCSRVKLMRHLESQFRDGMTWANYGRVWQIDHVIPICRFDLTRPDQVSAACHWTNFQPLLREENGRKGARITEPQGELPLPESSARQRPTRAQLLGVEISDEEVRDRILIQGGLTRRNATVLGISVWELGLILDGVGWGKHVVPAVVNKLPWLEDKTAFNPAFETP